MQNNESQESLQKHQKHVLFHLLAENYELSQFVLPKIKPNDDSLDKDEMDKLIDLIMDKDFYEINSIIRKRYKTV